MKVLQVKKYASPEEIESIFGLNPRTLANERSKRIGIPFIKKGRKILYRISDVEKSIEAGRVLTKDSINQR